MRIGRISKSTIAGIVLLAVSSTGYCGTNQTLKDAGDVLQYATTIAAFGSTLVAGNPQGGLIDYEGFYQAAKSTAAIGITQVTWKEIFASIRPDFSNTQSYPSGHTAGACGGGAFLTARYWDQSYWWLTTGFGMGGCLVTAYSRVDADRHFVNDVTASFGISWIYTALFVTSKSTTPGVTVVPMAMDGGAGVMLAMSDQPSDPAGEAGRRERRKSTRWRFEFDFGPAYLIENRVSAPSATGTTFDLDNFDKNNDPTPYARLAIAYQLDARQSMRLDFVPFESRDTGTSPVPITFGGQTFPANETLVSSWRQTEVRAGWLYDLQPSGDWIAKAGFDLLFNRTVIQLQTDTESIGSSADAIVFWPLLRTSLGYRFTPKLSGVVDVEGIYLGDNWYLQSLIGLNYDVNKSWALTAGYAYYGRRIESASFDNKVQYQGLSMQVAYSW